MLQFLANDDDIRWRINADFHPITVDGEDSDADRIVQDDGFPCLAT